MTYAYNLKDVNCETTTMRAVIDQEKAITQYCCIPGSHQVRRVKSDLFSRCTKLIVFIALRLIAQFIILWDNLDFTWFGDGTINFLIGSSNCSSSDDVLSAEVIVYGFAAGFELVCAFLVVFGPGILRCLCCSCSKPPASENTTCGTKCCYVCYLDLFKNQCFTVCLIVVQRVLAVWIIAVLPTYLLDLRLCRCYIGWSRNHCIAFELFYFPLSLLGYLVGRWVMFSSAFCRYEGCRQLGLYDCCCMCCDPMCCCRSICCYGCLATGSCCCDGFRWLRKKCHCLYCCKCCHRCCKEPTRRYKPSSDKHTAAEHNKGFVETEVAEQAV